MNNSKYKIVQLHAALTLVGYWLFQSVFVRIYGETTQLSSIVYEGLQVVLSIYVLIICKRDSVVFGKKEPILAFYSVLLILYSLRVVFDIFFGPFSGKVAPLTFLQDFLLIVCLTFLAAWALIASRKWLDVDLIAKLVFWMGIVAIVFIRSDLQSIGVEADYTQQRIEVSGGLTSLAVVRLAVFVVIAAIHLLLNTPNHNKIKYVYLLGLIVGVWMSLASGSRGGVVGLVIALGLYFIFSSRRSPLLIILAILVVVVIVVNIVPILVWISDFFPVFSDRMLSTILENDQSTRDEIRKEAINCIYQNPIFGYSYRLYYYTSGYRTHNGILDVALALGIPMGILFVYFVYIKTTFIAIKNMVDKRLFYPTVMLLFVLVSSMSSSSITDSGFNFAVCLLCATCCHGNNRYIGYFSRK